METLLSKIDLDRRFDVEIEDEDVPPRRLKLLLERHTHQSLLSDRDETKTTSTLPTRLTCVYSPSNSSSFSSNQTIKCITVSSNFVIAGNSNHSVTFWPRNVQIKMNEEEDEDEEDEEEEEEIRVTNGIQMAGHESRIWCVDSETNQDSEIVVSGSSDGTV